MACLTESGLEECAQEIMCSYNGPKYEGAAQTIFPAKATVAYHGPQSFTENLTINQLHLWAFSHAGWDALYFHAKGASRQLTNVDAQMRHRWRRCLLSNLVCNWRSCVDDLNRGAEMVTCHWLTGQADGTQNIPAGNFLWVKSDFVATLPSMYKRDRIKMSGMTSPESRYEAEVFWGNGPRLPKVIDKHPGHPNVHYESTL